MSNYKIYAHINKANGKLYIGQTCRRNVETRFGKNGIQYKKCLYFWNAIQKYGWDNFEHVVLMEGLSKKMADIIEIELIKKYRTTESSYGYNLSPGGSNGSSTLKRKQIYQYTVDGEYMGKWESAQIAGEALNIIPSNISACCLGISQTCAKYVWSYSKLPKEYFEDINLPYCRKVKQYDKYGKYIKTHNSIISASIETGCKYGSISNSCRKNGLEISNNKYRWTYDNIEIDVEQIKNVHKSKTEVVQYGLDGKYIRTWESATLAEREIGVNHSHVIACCKGRYKTTGGYIWKYKEDEVEEIKNISEYLQHKKPKYNPHYTGSKRVAQYTIDGKFVRYWERASQAIEYYGGAKSSTSIQACCRGKVKSAYGYLWKYE